MADRPLLRLPPPEVVRRHTKQPTPLKAHYPGPSRQAERLTPKFEHIEAGFVQLDPAGIEPERAVVLEIAGTIEGFWRAVERTPGLEWLAETEWDALEADDDFHLPTAKTQWKALRRRLYVVMSNQRGARELVSLWRRWQRRKGQPKYRWGLAKWKDLFTQLVDVRFWGAQDRLAETGLREEWEERRREGAETIRVEIELWFRINQAHRQRAEHRVQRLVEEQDGAMISRCEIEAIGYHAVLVDLPIAHFGAIFDRLDYQIVRCEHVMFLRPQGQAVVQPQPGDLDGLVAAIPAGEPPGGSPTVALLDGLPLENHALLRDRLVVDDPDGWASIYQESERNHGTAMASLILHGDLEEGQLALTRPLYVRPLLRPDPKAPIRPAPEKTPEDRLIVDLVHQAVRRIFEGDGGEPAASPGVRVINVSLGDGTRPFLRMMSPWARLLDFLSGRYRVLFLVSAGNHPELELPSPCREVDDGSRGASTGLEGLVLLSVWREQRHRRLLSPAESLNALTIGALHKDASGPTPTSGYGVDPLPSGGDLPAPYSALGMGFQRAVKPDLLLPGGRQIFNLVPAADSRCKLAARAGTGPPGQRVALPARSAGRADRTGYFRGTSNAAALSTRAAAQLVELLEAMRLEGGEERLPQKLTAVLVKALLVHGAAWSGLDDELRARLSPMSLGKDDLSRFLGYGSPSLDRVLTCTEERATLVGCGAICDDEGHRYRLPLPPSLSGRRDWRCLTVTLAWLSPINPRNLSYRKAALWFEPHGERQEEIRVDSLGRERKYQGKPFEEYDATSRLVVKRREADWRSVRRGTVQHERLEGERAAAFVDGDEIHLQVNCRADAGKLKGEVPYGFVVTLEVAEGVGIPVYEEIRSRLQIPVAP